MKDYYKILGITKNSSQEDVKKAYRKLAHKHHPDKGGDEAKFKEINEAYQILSDQEKRSQYDKFGRVFEGSAGGQPGGGFSGFRWGWGGQPGAQGDEEGEGGPFGFDFQDIGDLFGDFFGEQERAKNPRKGSDIEVVLELPLEATLAKTDQELVLRKFVSCSRCNGVGADPGTRVKECFSCRGTGEVQQIRRTVFGSFTRNAVCPECGGEGLKPEKLCTVCKGEGRTKDQETVKLSVPAGVDTNQILRFEGRGEAGRKKGKSGDLYVRIAIKPHPLFKRAGDDLFTTLFIPFTNAVLGGEVEISTLEGTPVALFVPEGSESGRILKVPGRGIPHFHGLGRGNLAVELKIKVPKKPTREQRELLDRMKKEGL